MQQANWMSLGIIVTLLACMVQRLASSMRPTKNASAASCKHIMVLPWKCRSVLPTSWAISWTSHEKGSFLIRSSVLFWNHARSLEEQLCQAGTSWSSLLSWSWGIPSRGLCLPSRAELPLNWLLPWNRWPSLCSHLGQLLGWQWWWWLTHFLQPSSLLYPPLSLFHHLLHLPCGWGLSGWGGVVHRRGGPPSFLCMIFSQSSFGLSTFFPSLSFLGVNFVLAILSKIKKNCSKLKTLLQDLNN